MIEKGYSGREIRFVLINAHYRSGLNFAFSALDDARKSLARIDHCTGELEKLAKTSGIDGGETPPWAAECLDDFAAAVNDDLNLPGAFAALFDLVRRTNAALAKLPGETFSASKVLAVFKRMDEVLGVIFFGNETPAEPVPAEVADLLNRRAQARTAKDWAESDRLRDEISRLGWQVKDSKEGQTVTRKGK